MTANTPAGVPFFSGAASVRRDWPRLEQRVRDIVARGRFHFGPVGRELEGAIAAFTGARHAVAVNSGTDALIILLRAAGIGPGDEVIVPAYTFFATASSVVHVGAEPVLVDIDPDSYAMAPAAARAAITPRTRAIMPVHLFSQLADMSALRALADEFGLLLLEDSAEGIGMRAQGTHAGLFGVGGVLSFFPTKTLGALGDAGMVLTDDDEVAARARRLRQHGDAGDGSGVCLEPGYNSRCDEIQSAILLERLAHLTDDIARRADLVARYDERLAAVAPGLVTPRLVRWAPDAEPVWYVYLIEAGRRDELAAFLGRHGVGTEAYYPRPLTDQPALRDRPGARHPVPVAAAASRRALALPLYPDLRDEQVDQVCDLVLRFHKEAA